MSVSKVKIRKGDEVVVLTGRAKGSTGKVEHVDKEGSRVSLANINVYKKHQKANAKNPDGGIIDKPMPLHISNVAIVDPKTKKASRVGYKLSSEGKTRISKASGSAL